MINNLLILRRAQKELSGLPEAIYSKVNIGTQKLADDLSNNM